MKIAITGAAGNLGGTIAQNLLDRPSIDPADVVLITRRPDAVAELTARGAAARPADFADPASLKRALQDVERLMLVSVTAGPERARLQADAVAAAAETGVSHVIYNSVPNPSSANPIPGTEDHRATEEALSRSGMSWTVLRNALNSEYRIPEAQGAAAAGVLAHNFGDGRTASVSRHDCAAVAAAVLASDGHRDTVYDITGPELMDAQQLADAYASVTGAEITPLALDDDAYRALLLELGAPAPIANFTVAYGRAVREGQLDQLSDAVHTLTGRPPASLADVLQTGLTATV